MEVDDTLEEVSADIGAREEAAVPADETGGMGQGATCAASSDTVFDWLSGGAKFQEAESVSWQRRRA